MDLNLYACFKFVDLGINYLYYMIVLAAVVHALIRPEYIVCGGRANHWNKSLITANYWGYTVREKHI